MNADVDKCDDNTMKDKLQTPNPRFGTDGSCPAGDSSLSSKFEIKSQVSKKDAQKHELIKGCGDMKDVISPRGSELTNQVNY